MKTFNDFPLNPLILKALTEQGFEKPTEIQEKAFTHLLTTELVDFHGQAQTGTGKTLAFGIPLVQTIDSNNASVQALIVAPTRELVLQISESLQTAARYSKCNIVSVYGGVSIEQQIHALRRAQIVVGTPGRLNDHLRRKTLSIKALRTLVLDEADIMLEMGFKEEVDAILSFAPEDRQIWLFSATVKPGIAAIKNQYMKNPVVVQVSKEKVGTTNTKQYYCIVPVKHKLSALLRIIDCEPDFYGIIFCRTRILASEITQELGKRGYNAHALHGDINQAMRNSVIAAFKARKFSILVATDVAARGIDVDHLSHVVNHCIPDDQEGYVHRVGRTGRAGRQGVAISLISSRDIHKMQSIARRFTMKIEELEVPSLDAVAQVRLNKVQEYIAELSNQPMSTSVHTTKLSAMLQEQSPETVARALHAMLYNSMLKSVDEQQDISFGSSSYDRNDRGDRSGGRGRSDRSDRPTRTYEVDPNSKELMIHAGLMDGVTKADLIDFLTQSRAISGNDIGKIRVIQKRSFVHVPTQIASSLITKLKGQRLCGKTVRINIGQR
jgi:ATP-dependent RNA helicase DeaD